MGCNEGVTSLFYSVLGNTQHGTPETVAVEREPFGSKCFVNSATTSPPEDFGCSCTVTEASVFK